MILRICSLYSDTKMISLKPNLQPIQHGGNIEDAIKHYGIPREQWIDLSTGISPWSYPFKPLPEKVWQELPPPQHNLLANAATYYGVMQNHIVATPGSQIAIRLLPQLFKPSTVAVPALGYKEHALSWQMAHHQTAVYSNASELLDLVKNKQVEHAVVINPNNPSCEKFSLQILQEIAENLGGVCVIDEAFIDCFDPNSTQISSATNILNLDSSSNVIILRSIGKFFGLAGIRLGFSLGKHPCLHSLDELLQPWSISHASQDIGIQALQDTQWQQQQRINIKQQQRAFQSTLTTLLDECLQEYSTSKSSLFNTVFATKSELKELHHQLAKQGIWTRLGNKNDPINWLRFGLPKDIDEIEKRTLHLQ